MGIINGPNVICGVNLTSGLMWGWSFSSVAFKLVTSSYCLSLSAVLQHRS